MITIQERLAAKAAASIASGVASSSDTFGTNILSDTGTLNQDPASVQVVQEADLSELAAHYKGKAYYAPRIYQIFVKGGRKVVPDENMVYVPGADEIAEKFLEDLKTNGLVTLLETKE